MNKRQAGILNIAISIVFAIAMIGVSWATKGENNFVWVGLLVAVWWVPFTVLSNWGNQNGSIAGELRCVGRKISRVFSK